MEVELKFQVPAAARARLLRAVATTTARTTRLRAIYVDTADDRLAAAGLALRLRREGPRWVQTLKGHGSDAMQRREHEVALAPTRGTPVIDPARHADSAIGRELVQLLGNADLQPRYRTDVQRCQRLVRYAGAVIEVAFDQGHILAGRSRRPVCEVEFELKSGLVAALLQLAQTWVQRHGLWLDVRSKSAMGLRLALGVDRVAAQRSLAPVYAKDAKLGQALAAMLQATLAQMLPNAAELGGGTGTAEHVHQWRVAVRRLRSALRLFAPWSATAELALALEQRWREPFAVASAVRDDDAVEAMLAPVLAAAGLPAIQLHRTDRLDAAMHLAQDPTLTRLVLQTWQLADASAGAAPVANADTVKAAGRTLLRQYFRRAMKLAPGFAQAASSEQHRLRKRLKSLRYAVEFLAPALGGRSRKPYLALCRAVDALGVWNDLIVAAARLQRLDLASTSVAYARGWVAARQDAAMRDAVSALKKLEAAPRFWR